MFARAKAALKRWAKSPAVAALVAAFVLGLAVRIYLAAARGPPVGDEVTYLSCAQNVLAGRGWLVPLFGLKLRLFLPPGYPAFLLPFVAAFGDAAPWAAAGAQAALGIATAALLSALGKRLAGNLAGVVAGAAFALHPYMIYYSARVLSETWALFLFALFLYFYLDAAAGRRRLAVSFVFLALAALTRPVFIYVGVAAVACLLVRRQDERPRARLGNVALATLVFALVLAPWTVRNYQLSGRFIPVNYNVGRVLYQGNWPLAGDDVVLVRDIPGTDDFRRAAAARGTKAIDLELTLQDLTLAKARALISGHKGAFLRLSGRRLAHMFALYPTLTAEGDTPAGPGGALAFIAAFTIALYICAAAGFIAAPGRLAKIFLPTAAIITILPHVISVSLLRYRLPMDLILTLAAGFGVAAACRLWAKTRRGARTPAPGGTRD